MTVASALAASTIDTVPMGDGHWLCCNAAAWKGLPDELKTIVGRNLNAAAVLEREDIARNDKVVQADLEKAGLVFNVAETQSFRDGLKEGGLYKYWHDKLGDEPWGLLELYAGKLG
jgi:TRAP-type C4-dicarboxylate transport system substrate-binding protein